MEVEVSVLCQTEATVHPGIACRHLIIHLPVVIHFMEDHFPAPSLAQAVEDFHGVEAVEDVLVAGEGSVVGSGNL